MWSDNVTLHIAEKNRFFFYIRIEQPNTAPWTLICIYGDASHRYNRALWDRLKEIIRLEGSVCIIGDFNAIAKEDEKYGGNQNLDSNGRGFRKFLFDGGLMDLGFRGPAYTWTNGQYTSTPIFSRLDRVVVTAKWLQEFPQAYVNHMPRVHSDHAAILLRTKHVPPKPRNFRIENWWFSKEGFLDSWQHQWAEARESDWATKWANMKRDILNWAKA